MLAILSLLAAQAVTLEDVYRKVRPLPGVVIEAEMVSPTVQPMTFKISPEGYFWAKYQTTESFETKDLNTTWMPSSREYSTAKPEVKNPCTAGFDCLWPGGPVMRQVGDTGSELFHKRDCWVLPCKGDFAHTVQLFVEKASLMPYGTRVDLNGTRYEMVFKSVEVKKLDSKHMRFLPPRGAKVFDPKRGIPKLIAAGSKLRAFEAEDFDGRRHTLKSMLKGNKGLVFNFWFAGCTGCFQEMPMLVKLAPRLAKSGIHFVGADPVDEAKFARLTSLKNQLPFPTLVGKGAENLEKQIGVRAYPVTVVIDSKGVIIDAIQSLDEARLNAAIRKLDPNWRDQ
ncbi:MAG: TlpA disulfide reductase family protein [Fimbriimonadaceae bacterium]